MKAKRRISAVGIINIHTMHNKTGREATLMNDGTYYGGGYYARYRRGVKGLPQDAVIGRRRSNF